MCGDLSSDLREPPDFLTEWLRLGTSRMASSIANYQSKWLTYRRWCYEEGRSVSNPSVAKVADYLLWLWDSKGLSLSSVKAHRSMLSAVFRFKLPELGEHHVLRDHLRSFAGERPRHLRVPPSWNLDVVLRYLMSSEYEPLERLSLRALTKKTLFLVALATAKRVEELQALSRQVAFRGPDMFVSYLPYFVAKTDRPDAPLPRSFKVCSLRKFAGDLEEGSLLCPVRSIRAYLERTKSAVSRASSLFVSLRSPSRQISKNAVSFFLREVISGAGAVYEDMGTLRVHSIRGAPLRLFLCKTGWSLRCWRPHLGGQIQFLPCFIYVMFSTSWKACVPAALL